MKTTVGNLKRVIVEAFEAEPSNAHEGGGDYESFADVRADHPEAAEQWLDNNDASEDDAWWEDTKGNLWGMVMGPAHPSRKVFEWLPDRGWEPREDGW